MFFNKRLKRLLLAIRVVSTIDFLWSAVRVIIVKLEPFFWEWFE